MGYMGIQGGVESRLKKKRLLRHMSKEDKIVIVKKSIVLLVYLYPQL